jgi:hypothetical protein
MTSLQKCDIVNGLNADKCSNAIQNLLHEYFHICSTGMTTVGFEGAGKKMSQNAVSNQQDATMSVY